MNLSLQHNLEMTNSITCVFVFFAQNRDKIAKYFSLAPSALVIGFYHFWKRTRAKKYLFLRTFDEVSRRWHSMYVLRWVDVCVTTSGFLIKVMRYLMPLYKSYKMCYALQGRGRRQRWCLNHCQHSSVCVARRLDY